jgi:hypothetical protein
VDSVPMGVCADRPRWHPLIEPNYESVHRDADCDDLKSFGGRVDQAEREYESVRNHEKRVTDCLNLVVREVNVFESNLDREADSEKPSRINVQMSECPPVSPGQQDDQSGANNRYEQQPHA